MKLELTETECKVLAAYISGRPFKADNGWFQVITRIRERLEKVSRETIVSK